MPSLAAGPYRSLVILLVTLTLIGCASRGPYQVELMPAPEVYQDGAIDPFAGTDREAQQLQTKILYATSRQPATEPDKERFYRNERGYLLRLGYGEIMHADGKIDWEEARRISLLKNRNEKYPLKVTDVSELGVLKESTSAFTDPTLLSENLNRPGLEFAKLINDKLAISEKKDIFIYVHGYKVIFENPLLVATELWHFTGYDGVFIAYSWPSTPKALAYVSDIETASMSAHFLRTFIEYLSQDTHAARIHILGYSAGTRVVIEALAQLSLIYSDPDNPSVRPTTRVGQVILVGSDYDRGLFAAALEDGLLSTVDTLTVYLSDTDEALGFSSWLFNRNRLGELFDEDMPQHISELFNSRDDFFLVDVTPAENAHAGNGHSYFRQSPWVSSDVLMTLYNGLPPAERGLVKKGDLPTYTFPENYVVRLRALLTERYPELATELPVTDY